MRPTGELNVIPSLSPEGTTSDLPMINQHDNAEHNFVASDSLANSLGSVVREELRDSGEWEVQPTVLITPSNTSTLDRGNAVVREREESNLGVLSQPENPSSCMNRTRNQEPKDLSPEVMLISQMPADIVSIIAKTGLTRNNTVLTCLLANGEHYRIKLPHFKSIVGITEFHRLLDIFESDIPRIR